MNKRTFIFAAIPTILVIFGSAALQTTFLSNPEKIASWLSSFGSAFILVYIIVQIASIVIAPIGGAFISLPMIAILGPVKGVLLSYFVVTPAYFINFYLSKKYGRGLVKSLIGQNGLEKIDHITKDAGSATFIILKILQGGYFDYVAYAMGLTKITWKTFSLINIIGGIPSALITYIILSRFKNFLSGVLALYIFSAILIAISIYLNHKRLGHKNLTKSELP